MKETKENQKSGKGWHENKEEVLTEKGIEQKAPIHRKVAMRDRYSNTLRVPFAIESDEKEKEFSDEIIKSIQDKRKPHTAEEIDDMEEPEEPEELDESEPEEVDDKTNESKKDEDGEE